MNDDLAFLLQAYVDDQLPADLRARLEQRLADEPALQAEVDALRAETELLGRWASPFHDDELTLPPERRGLVMRQALAASRQRQRIAFRPRLLAAAALVVLVIGGALLVQPAMQAGQVEAEHLPAMMADDGATFEAVAVGGGAGAEAEAEPAEERFLDEVDLVAPSSAMAPPAAPMPGRRLQADKDLAGRPPMPAADGAVAEPLTRLEQRAAVADRRKADDPMVLGEAMAPQDSLSEQDDSLAEANGLVVQESFDIDEEAAFEQVAGYDDAAADDLPELVEEQARGGHRPLVDAKQEVMSRRDNNVANEDEGFSALPQTVRPQQQRQQELKKLKERARPAIDNERAARIAPQDAALLFARPQSRLHENQPVLGLVALQQQGLPLQIDPAALSLAQGRIPAAIGGRSPASAFARSLITARQAGLQLRREGDGWLVARPQPQATLETFGLWPDELQALVGTRGFIDCAIDHRSTFALDGDTASFDRTLQALRLGADDFDPLTIQAEHFVNAMELTHPLPEGDEAFAVVAEAAPSPLVDDLHLVSVAVVPRPAPPGARQHLRLTIALDTSGSMAGPGGLERVQAGLARLIAGLDDRDRVSLVTFGDRARLLLPFTPGDRHELVLDALNGIGCDGATNLAEGVALAYQVAASDADPAHANRVVLITDGATMRPEGADDAIQRLAGYDDLPIDMLLLTCGTRPQAPRQLERLVDAAGGRHLFLASQEQAMRVFSHDLLPEHLAVLGRDAKVQVIWNPQRVSHFRLVGYEERHIDHADFRNDAVGGGALDSQQTVTALYEVRLRQQSTDDLATVQLRFFDTRRGEVRELATDLATRIVRERPSDQLRLAAAAAACAEWLQCGWYSNLRNLQAERLLAMLHGLQHPKATVLRTMIRLANGRVVVATKGD